MSKPQHEFVIRYKSGAEVKVRADTLSITWNTAEGIAAEAQWENMQPNPLALGLVNIESVWEVA